MFPDALFAFSLADFLGRHSARSILSKVHKRRSSQNLSQKPASSRDAFGPALKNEAQSVYATHYVSVAHTM